jgi:opacity protein-like surface antigen
MMAAETESPQQGRHAMVNLIIGAPIGTTEDAGFKPYVSAGLGVIKTSADGNLDDHFSNNDFGMNFGAGGIAFINEPHRITRDIRYFRALTDPKRTSSSTSAWATWTSGARPSAYVPLLIVL